MSAAGGDDQEEDEDSKDKGIERGRQAYFGTTKEFAGEVKEDQKADGLKIVGGQIWILSPEESESDREDEKEGMKKHGCHTRMDYRLQQKRR